MEALIGHISFLTKTFVLSILGVIGLCIYSMDRGPTAQQIADGRALFMHEWQPDDPLSGEGDGLGPVFNETSCVACHSQGGVGGAGGNESNVLTFEVDPDHDRDRTEVVQHVVHSSAIHDSFLESRKTVGALFPVIPGGATIVAGCNVSLTNHNPVTFQEVNSPALFGVGVLDEISDWSVVKHNARRFGAELADEFGGNFEKKNGRGFARSDLFGNIGKFGWKGQFVSLEDFVASACAMEMGLTNPQVAQPIPLKHNEDDDAKLDMTQEQLDSLVAFVKSLPPPQQILPNDGHARDRVAKGEALFNQVACSDCHVKDLGNAKGIFTDLQLYSLERSDIPSSYVREDREIKFARPGTVPLPEHWKTPALWGVADSAPYFHDGQSPTLEAAIQRHHGAAQRSNDLYNKLSKDNRAMLVEFLKTLRAPQNI